MSKPDCPSGSYTISSLVNTYQPTTSVGIAGDTSGYVPVSLNQPICTWTITPPQLPGTQGSPYLLSICCKNTEVRGNRVDNLDTDTVVASDDHLLTLWYITLLKDNEYLIQLNSDQSKGWTVPDQSDYATIVVRPIIKLTENPPQYPASQVFRILPA